MIESMEPLHISEADAFRDFAAILERVQAGVEIVIEREAKPFAAVRAAAPVRRTISQCIALAEARGSTVTLDEGFMKDIEEGIASRSQPWNPPSWE